MKKLMMTFALVAAVAMAETWTGTISDSKCRDKHVKARDSPRKSMACTIDQVERGAEPVFVVGDKVLLIANPSAVKDVLGQKVELTGELKGNAVTVAKVSPVAQ